MIRVLALFLLVVSSIAYSEDEYTFDNYEFEWKVFTVNELDYSVIKTQDRNFLQIRKDYSMVRLTSDEAVEISKALAFTTEYFKKQSDANVDTSNEVDAGEYNVLFYTSKKYGFSVRIGDDSSTRLTSITLSKDEALKLQIELVKAESMINFVKSKINF